MKTFIKITGIMIILAIIFIIYFITLKHFYPAISERGQFGDMFGSLNALFTGLAFIGVIYTIYLQRQELSLQRVELELTRKELARTAVAQEESQIALTKQAESLKLTAKLNGLSSLLQFELAKPSTQSKLKNDMHFASYFSNDSADSIINQIKDIITVK